MRAIFGIRCVAAVVCLCCCAACGGSAPPAGDNQSGAANASAASSGANSAGNGSANAGGQSADLSKLDAWIAQLENEAEQSPDDDTARSALADAYVRRGNALHDAHRLMDALHDYQSALKFSPDHEEASLRVAQLTQEIGEEPHAEDGKPVSVPAKPEPTS